MANILMLTPQLPYPPHQGTSLRNLHMLKALAQGHLVTLLSFSERIGTKDLGPLPSLCRILDPVPVSGRTTGDRLAQMARSPLPDVALRLKSGDYEAALVDALSRDSFDAVQVEGIELAGYITDIRRASPESKIVLDCHNAETELQRRALSANLSNPSRWPVAVYSSIQARRLARFEKWALRQADGAIAVSDEDKGLLERLTGATSTPIVVIPNTIDIDEYADTTGIVDADSRQNIYDLVFTGKMDYRPNIDGVLWFVGNVWHELKRNRPQTTWAIVGQKPDDKVKGLQKLEGIVVTGHVPRIQPYIHGASIYIVPLRIGSGTRLKLIEAMAAGKAIVSTSVGAEGLDLEDGKQLMLADTRSEWVGTLIRLLDDAILRNELGAAARESASKYDWRQIIDGLNAYYHSIMTGG